MRHGASLLSAAVVSAGVAWLAFRLWPALGLPATGDPLDAPFPGLWRWFFALTVPALFPAFTFLHDWLVRWIDAEDLSPRAARLGRLWDRASYGLLLAFPLLMLGWRQLGGWRGPFAAFFLGVLALKVVGVLVTLYRGSVTVFREPDFRDPFREDPRGEPRALRWSLFWVALLAYGFLAPYVVTAVSTAGDEHLYLLNVESLRVDGDLETGNQIAGRAWTKFYWGRPAHPAEWAGRFVGFPLVLWPGYALLEALLPAYPLAGRLGAVLTIAVFGALLGVQAYRLCRDLGASRPAAFWAWVALAWTPPVVINTSHVYPELLAAWAATVAVRAILRIPAATWRGLATVALATAFMAVLKDRFVPLGVGLCLWAFSRLAARRPLLGTLLGLGLLGAAVAWVFLNPWPVLFRNLDPPAQVRATLLTWNWHMATALVGLWADQEFGLLFHAPVWLLAGAGYGAFRFRRRDAARGLVGVGLLYLLVLIKYRWAQWDAGWTPPPRFVLVLLPLLTPFVAECFDRARGRWLAPLHTVGLVWSTAVLAPLLLVPFWRYNDLDGRTTLLQLAGAALGLDLARFLPSLRAPTPWTWVVLAFGAWWLLGAARRVAREVPLPAAGWGVGSVLLSPGATAVRVAALGGLWLVAAAYVPTWSVEGEAMQHSRGVQFGSYQYQPILWVMKQDGELWERIVTWPGHTEIGVVAGGYTTTGVAPRLTLLLGDRVVGEWTLAAGEGRWVEVEYVADVRTTFGRPVLRLRLSGLGEKDGRSQHAYVDRVRIRPPWTGR